MWGCDEIGRIRFQGTLPLQLCFTRCSYNNSTWQAFFEESKLEFKMIYLVEFFLDCLLQMTKLDMGSTRKLGMFKGPTESRSKVDNIFLPDL
jgi:hypothetical protein